MVFPLPKNPRPKSTPTDRPGFGHGGARGWGTGEMETGEMANDEEEMGNATEKKWVVDWKRNGHEPAKEIEPKKWSQRNGKNEMNGRNGKWRR